MEYQSNHKRPQDDLPYERRMLYVIKDYRRLLQANEVLETYCKQLEHSNQLLQEENARLKSSNKALEQKKNPTEGTINSLYGLLNKKRETIQYQTCRISMLQRELNEYKRRFGEL